MTNPLFDRLFQRHAGSAAPFLMLPGGDQITYGAFLEDAARYAHVLVAQGLRPGDRLAVQIPKSPQALILYAAAVQAGVIFLPLNTAYTGREVAYFLDNSGARLLVCDPANAAELSPLMDGRVLTLDAQGQGSLQAAAAAQPREFATVPRTEADLAAFLYTSGTTGRSKGAMLTQANLLSNAETLAAHWHFTKDDVLLHALPIYHTHGLFVALNVMLSVGGAMIFLPKFDQDQMIALMPRATTMMGVPTFYTRLLDDPRFTADLTRDMRLFISGSAPLLADTHIAFEERTGHRILERYGMTETNMNTSNPYSGERRAGTVGMPLPGVELKVTGPDGNSVPQGEIGVIEVRGPNVFQGYWQMPEKTAAELRADGWFITGDLGQIDADGYVSIVGRGKDLIISGGFNIYPKEIELVLDEHPGVLESAVIGVPHPDFGETPVGVLVASGEGPDLAALQGAVKAELARFKHPSKYVVVQELPRNTMGKVQKNVLRETYKGLFQPAGTAAP